MNTTIKKILNSTILLWISSSINILLAISAVIIDGRLPKYLFGADNPKANGDFLTICFSVIGGGAVIYGLYLNNKKIGEQIRQNDIAKRQADIAANSNNDKRFGDAVGYLGNENKSIVIGGIYALYQLAKDNKSYRLLVANIFLNYLNSASSTLYAKTKEIAFAQDMKFIFQVIIDCLFDKDGVFIDENVELNNIRLVDVKFKNPIINAKFELCEFVDCRFDFLKHCEFTRTSFDNSNLNNHLESCQLSHCNYKYCFIYGDIINSSISSIFPPEYLTIFSERIVNSSFSQINSNTVGSSTLKNCNKFNFQNCTFVNSTVYDKNNALLIHCKNEPEFE